jgi:polyisoprenoid-binding protein YceI
MNSIANSDLTAENGKEKLEGHLKTGDFFETEKYPTGKFEITSVSAASGVEDATHLIEGNLTMKGVTKSVKLPAHVAITDSKITAVTPAFTINRTEWGITFKSGIIGTVKDKSINDEIGLVISLAADAK